MSEPSAAAMQQAYQALKNVPLGEWWYDAVLKKAREIDASALDCGSKQAIDAAIDAAGGDQE